MSAANGPNNASPPPAVDDPLIGWLIGPVLLVCAVWFAWGTAPADVPYAARAAVDPADLTTDPLRSLPAGPPTLEVAGFTKKCAECHSLFRLNRAQPLLLSQHRGIVQGHGMNDRCFNCHASPDPSELILPDGEKLPFAEAHRLCATCHGTTYRDWERQMHGRTTGSWDTDSAAHDRLSCTECHDPHAPAFAPMSVLAGPSTLRLGSPAPRSPSSDHEGTRNPLRQWSRGGEKDPH